MRQQKDYGVNICTVLEPQDQARYLDIYQTDLTDGDTYATVSHKQINTYLLKQVENVL